MCRLRPTCRTTVVCRRNYRGCSTTTYYRRTVKYITTYALTTRTPGSSLPALRDSDSAYSSILHYNTHQYGPLRHDIRVNTGREGREANERAGVLPPMTLVALRTCSLHNQDTVALLRDSDCHSRSGDSDYRSGGWAEKCCRRPPTYRQPKRCRRRRQDKARASAGRSERTHP